MHTLRRHALSQAAAAALGLTSILFSSHASGQVVERGMMRPAQPRAATGAGVPARAAPQGQGQTAPTAAGSAPRLACTAVTTGEPISLALGKSRLIQLQSPAIRLIGGGRSSSYMGAAGETSRPATPGAPVAPGAGGGGAGASDGVAETEITLLSPTEMLVVGRRPGSANVIVQDREGRCVVRDITVTVDPQTLEGTLRQLVPGETGVRVVAADNAIVLTGTVRDTSTVDQVMTVADVYGNGRRIVNLLRVSAPQQVMLEVKIAEVSKALIDRFGLDFARAVSSGDRTNILQGIIGGQSAVLGRFGPNAGTGNFTGSAVAGVSSSSAAAAASISNSTRGASLLGIDVENRDGIFRVLAEPNIMAISGQAASFLSGGKIFIPVAQTSQGGGSTITLEEKEFGVGLKFTPTVLDGRINLKVVSEVSELSQTGTPFTTVGGVTSVVPSMTTRRVDTTIQLADGQSFAVAGLIRNNVAEALNKFPGLGETPVIGALFRSTEFQNDMTELMFVVTPRLVRPLAGPVTLPTDNHIVPSRADVILRGAGEGSSPLPPSTPAMPAPMPPAPPAPTPRPLGPTSEVTQPPSPIRQTSEVSAPWSPGLVQAQEDSAGKQAVALAAPGAPLPEARPLPPLPSPQTPDALRSDEPPTFE